MSVWLTTEATDVALARTVTGAIFAPVETQRLVVSGKTGTYSITREEQVVEAAKW